VTDHYPPTPDALRKAMFMVDLNDAALAVERDPDTRLKLQRDYIDVIAPVCCGLGPECLATMARTVLAALHRYNDGNQISLKPSTVTGLEDAIADMNEVAAERERIGEGA
jgi:hypothetical protein